MNGACLLEKLAHAGYLSKQPGPVDRWRVTDAGTSGGYTDEEGNRYVALDVAALSPLYQQLYARILAERLRLAGLARIATVTQAAGLLITQGPRDAMRAREPSAVAQRHLEAADTGWVEDVDRRWRQAARRLEDSARRCWHQLCQGRISEEAIQSLIAAKVWLNALAVDSLLPPATVAETWLAPYVEAGLHGDVVAGCYLPASGYVAYDVFEDECWRLAASLVTTDGLTEDARRRFVRRGLFFLYDTLDTDRLSYHLHDYPRELAVHYGRLVGGAHEIELRRDEIAQRSWRRRLHHWWAREQIEAISDDKIRQRLLLAHRLVGTGRDFDEEKRRLNSKLWRCLVALADALDVSLTAPEGTVEGLSAAIAARGGNVSINPVFHDEGQRQPVSTPELERLQSSRLEAAKPLQRS